MPLCVYGLRLGSLLFIIVENFIVKGHTTLQSKDTSRLLPLMLFIFSQVCKDSIWKQLPIQGVTPFLGFGGQGYLSHLN